MLATLSLAKKSQWLRPVKSNNFRASQALRNIAWKPQKLSSSLPTWLG
jgi:hypothetical protein